jgi:RAT1-interacting protein
LNAGFGKVVNVDISDVVIEKMKEMFAEEKALEWIQADCRSLPFENESFDVVMDKGTLDALVCSDAARSNGKSMLSEACRVLKSGGIFVEISCGSLNDRKCYFELCGNSWRRTHMDVVRDDNLNASHIVYMFQKD